jgi:Ca2+/H+ antiporter
MQFWRQDVPRYSKIRRRKMSDYDYHSIMMIVSMIVLMLLVMAIWWHLERGNDRAAIGYAIATLVVFLLFAWVQHKAEGRAELEHAAEHRAVQEQAESVQNF